MKFADFLNENSEENDNTVGSFINTVEKNIADQAKNSDIYTDGDIYVIDYKKTDEVVETKEILGFFIYKKDADQGDDFYIGKYIHRVSKNETDILIDDIKDSFTTIADCDLYIKNKLKGNILK